MKRKTAKPIIKPVDETGDCWTKQLSDQLTVADIIRILGFPPNCKDDPDKVRYSWGFTVNGKRCGIWDYRGRRWSAYDPDNVLDELFTFPLKY